MTFYRISSHLLYFLCCCSTFSNSYVQLYHTENAPSTHYYDCLYYTRSRIQDDIQDIKYCRQLIESQSLQRDFNQFCHNSGQLWSFEELSRLRVSASDILQWRSGMEQVDQYSKYLSNSSLDVEDKYLCNCTNPASFGKFCEYEFYNGSTSFDDAVVKQFEPLERLTLDNSSVYVGSQLHSNRPCYMTWTCNSGLMCLDWRHICDGKQQCLDGLDEDHCETLEFNECEDDEYRCVNGMCIPEEYWLDGDYDCMDWTDETDTIVYTGEKCLSTSSFVCDEHLCPYNQWSCGDGDCINDQADRHDGTRHKIDHFCKNMRDVNYMCEAVTRYSKSWWTIDGGYCLPYSLSYQTLGLDTTAVKNNCAFSLKCALSDRLDQDCRCKNATECQRAVNASCEEVYVVYPGSDPLLFPYANMMYERERDWTTKKPDKLLYEGRVKCMGYQLITIGARRYSLDESFKLYDYRTSENRLCSMREGIQANRNYSGPKYDVNCWNRSKSLNNRPYQVSFWCETRCISKYRVRDGIKDCHRSEEVKTINNACPQIQRHRLQCSPSEPACLLAAEVGNWGSSCFNLRDEIDHESGKVLRHTLCTYRTDPDCVYLRNYIRLSSYNITTKTNTSDKSILDDHLTAAIPFRSYCNSFFDTKAGFDELTQFCRQWVCSIDKYKCLSGQCISQGWICDGEWDCSDGSDEQGIFIMDHLDEHNSHFTDLEEMKERCYQQYRSDNTPFSDICNITSEYPCFPTGVHDPFNVTFNRPCINLTQIGDSTIDCLSGLDERNLLQCGRKGMLGFHFQFDDDLCVSYDWLCTTRNPWKPGINIAYDTVCFHQEKQFKNGTNSICNSVNDVMCLNDVCIKHARCNGKIECLHGEDEYRCVPAGVASSSYRELKTSVQFDALRLQSYPPTTKSLQNNHSYHQNVSDRSLSLDRSTLLQVTTKSESPDNAITIYEKRNSTMKSVYKIVRDSLSGVAITFEKHYLPFICNRGVAVKYYTGHTVCFCPPSFYGFQCEFYSDRITVVTHLDLTNYRPSLPGIAVIKVLAVFLFEDQVIDHCEFHVNPQIQNENNYIKQTIYFLYPRTNTFVQMKKNNRSGTHLYSVRFEVFNLHLNETIEPVGVWHYPIYFDFLPVFRLSKILRFHSSVASRSNDPCLNNSCGKNGLCQEVINSNRSSYFCSCKSGYYGNRCEFYQEECNNYCPSKSICKPRHRGILTGNQHPLCICPASTFGSSCHIRDNTCQKNPCLQGGTCILTYNMTNLNSHICLCTDLFDGDHCQFPKAIVNIVFMPSSNSTFQTSDIVAATVSYSDYDHQSLNFLIRYQQVYDALPSHLKLTDSYKFATYAPTIAILKIYRSNYHNQEPAYHLLYFHSGEKQINITVDLTSDNHCPLVQTLWHLVQSTERLEHSNVSTYNSSTAVFFYHRICRAKQNTISTLTCFRDMQYFCICEADHYRAECFGYNPSTDQCSFCLSNGYCLRGESNKKTDFLCLCPRCHHGKMCQYSTEIMSITLDSLIVKDVASNLRIFTGVYISIAVGIFLLGFFNNLCSFLTFIRPKSRKVGAGNYLLIVSLVDQCSLLLLLLKIIHIIFGSNGTLFYYENFNRYSCKIVSYLLSVCTRITCWLTSFVTIERLCVVLFPTSVTLKNPRLALFLSILIILTVFGMHVHEVLYYITIVDPSYTSVNVTLCITSYTDALISKYNRVNILLHYFIPFLIQVSSITVILIQITSSRMRASGRSQKTFADLFKKLLKTQKEQYVTPIIIFLSSLPQAVLSFSYACTELKQAWQRYILLTTYFLSYSPQVLGFILYVLPSTTYSEEFRQTIVGKKLVRQQQTSTIRQYITKTKTFLAKQKTRN